MSDTKVKVGLSCEGKNSDLPVLRILVKRLLDINEIDFEIKKEIPAGSGIIGFARAHTEEFFEEADPVDIGIYLTDQDDPNANRKKQVRDEIIKVNEVLANYTIIGVPDPHIEAWLIADQDLVKNIFGFRGEEKLPKENLKPKDRITYFQRNMTSNSILLYDAYERLANESNLKIIMDRCPEFADFSESLKAVCNSL